MGASIQSATVGVFVTVAVALAVLLRQRRRRSDALFVLFTLNLALWFLAAVFRGLFGSELWGRAELALGALVPASLLRLFVELLQGSTARVRRLMAVSYPLAGIFFVVAASPLGVLPIVQTVTGAYVAIMVLLATLLLRESAPERGVESARLRYLVIGALVTTAAAVLGRLPALGEPAAATGHLAVTMYVFFLSQAISKERLLDLHEFVSRVVVLGALGLLFAAITSVLIVGLGSSPSARVFNTIVSVIILLLLYEPLKERLETKALELFTRERYGLKVMLEQLRHRMLRVIEPQKMSKLMLDTLYDSRRATHAAVYLLDPLGHSFHLEAWRGPEPSRRVDERDLPALWHAIHRHKAPLLTEQLSRATSALDGESNRDLIENLRKVSADVLLPFLSGDRVLGFLAMRDDRVTEPFSTEEIAQLLRITEAAVIVLENSQLAGRIRERDRLAAIGEMAAGLAHEIRNPLGAIKGAAECLDPQGLKSEDTELLHVIVEETNRLNGVVSQFLDYARPFRARLSKTDLNEVIRKTAKLVETEKPAIRLELELEEGLPEIEVDPEQMKQVFLNLLINAFEASPDSAAPITVTSLSIADKERIELRVRDRGSGIPKEMLDHVFIPFFTTKKGGTGLGLAVCYRIVTSHGGFIHVQSQPGEGTEFVIRLPMKRAGEGSTTGSFQAPRPRRETESAAKPPEPDAPKEPAPA
ncbi:MAG: GAF domain-containing protein [Deltaproteobacteria bacterium]|nr:GAF domain-containing protein [Deltaproteobacteria bacterium]